jgi:signal transduction histidine kinase
MTELLLDTALTPEQATYAHAVKTSGETLLSLIEDLLDVSRLDAGKLPLSLRPFSLAAMIEELVELLAPQAQAKGIEIASYVDEQVEDSVIGDPARLRQVLLNLAGNAVKFTERGGVTIIVEPGDRANEVRFVVRDTGIGIAPEDQARIFLEFEQGDGGPTRVLPGSGLGLAIARRIVQRMGGALALDSTPGKGSTFTVTVVLPAAGPTPPILRHRTCPAGPSSSWLPRQSRPRCYRGGSATGAPRRESRPMQTARWSCWRSNHGTPSWSIRVSIRRALPMWPRRSRAR